MLTVASLCVVAALTAAIDQTVKGVISRRAVVGEFHRLVGGVGLRLVENQRTGLISRAQSRPVIILSVIVWSFVAACSIALATLAAGGGGLQLGLGLALGGAASNLCDRILRAAVVDFIVLWRWPIFNLADAAMVVGAIVVASTVL